VNLGVDPGFIVLAAELQLKIPPEVAVNVLSHIWHDKGVGLSNQTKDALRDFSRGDVSIGELSQAVTGDKKLMELVGPIISIGGAYGWDYKVQKTFDRKEKNWKVRVRRYESSDA
jgi:hypothetical protein